MNDNDYLGIDKFYHFIISFVITLIHPFAALAVAIGKEAMDLRSYGHWCWWDLLADITGIVAALPMWYLIWR